MLSVKAKQTLVDQISRAAAVLAFDGEDMGQTLNDVRRLNIKYASQDNCKPMSEQGKEIFEFGVALMKAQGMGI